MRKGRWAVVAVELYGLLQAGAQPAADGGPALARAIVGDQAVSYCHGVERVFDVGLLKSARTPI